jgi:hypothetical protein
MTTQTDATAAIPAQPLTEDRVISPSRSRRPAVVGTAEPLSGLSGALRRFAYSIPEHEARHWMLLLAADRVDVVEHLVGGSMRGSREDVRRLARGAVRVVVPLAAAALAFRALRRRQ